MTQTSFRPVSPVNSSAPQGSLEQFMDDPIEFFGHSMTQMQTIPRDELEGLQKQAIALRFKQHYEKIPILRKLADRLGVTEVREFDDLAPLLFAHTAFKSYPSALVDNKRFDLMTQWLDTLTAHDLSGVDASECTTIDGWLDLLDRETPLNVITSSGTTGTLSLIPKDKNAATEGMYIWKMYLFQSFGTEPTEAELNPGVDVIWPTFASGKLGHLRIADMVKHGFTNDDPSRFHALYSDAIDTDLMFLASKMRMAASRGELDRLVIPDELAERKDDFIAMQMRQPEEMQAFFADVSERLKGKRVFMTGAFPVMYDIARAGLDRGISNVFAKDSAILTGGGMKGVALPDNFLEVIHEFLGCDRIQMGYGYSELSAFHFACTEGRYHVQPWVVPILLDPNTSEPLPRSGRQTGRSAGYDLLNKSHWGGVMSGDEVTIDWDLVCPCGQTSVAFEPDIVRYSDKAGVEDDRITCAATHEVHNEAVNFMRQVEM